MGSSHSLTFKLLPGLWFSLQGVLRNSPPTPPPQSTLLSQLQTSSFLPDFHATEPQVGGQATPVIACDAVWLQQHLQLLKELWRQPEMKRNGVPRGEDQRDPVWSHAHSKCCLHPDGTGTGTPNIPQVAAPKNPSSPIAQGWLGDRGWRCPGFLL